MSENIGLSAQFLNVITAYTEKEKAIGKNGDLPWQRLLKADLKWLNILTTQRPTACIMGRKTFESLAFPLKDRINIVLTSRPDFLDTWIKKKEARISDSKYVHVFHNLTHAIDFCKSKNLIITILGGRNVYEEALKSKCKLFITRISDPEFKFDTIFPKLNAQLHNITKDVEKVLLQRVKKQTWELQEGFFIENNISYQFFTGFN